MKKIGLALICMLTIHTIAMAGNDKQIAVNKLPQTAIAFIESHFKMNDISYAKVEKEIFDKSYEVIFVDGSKIEFDKKGEWKEIDCQFTSVPIAAVPQQIKEFISKHHQGKKVMEIDRDRKDYEVKLDNGFELKFDLKFNFIGADR